MELEKAATTAETETPEESAAAMAGTPEIPEVGAALVETPPAMAEIPEVEATPEGSLCLSSHNVNTHNSFQLHALQHL